MLLQERVSEALRMAHLQIKEEQQDKKGRGKRGDTAGGDDEETLNTRLVKKQRFKKRN